MSYSYVTVEIFALGKANLKPNPETDQIKENDLRNISIITIGFKSDKDNKCTFFIFACPSIVRKEWQAFFLLKFFLIMSKL